MRLTFDDIPASPIDVAGSFESYMLDDVIPFWLRHGRDARHGGYCTFLDRDGSHYEENKICLWGQGRILWTFSTLYADWREQPEWLEFARHGKTFLDAAPLDPDGRLYYSLTPAGQPLHISRDTAADSSAVLGWTAWARAAGDAAAQDRARRHFDCIWHRLQQPGSADQEFIATTWPVRTHAMSMITLNILQELRKTDARADDNQRIDTCIDQLLNLNTNAERKCIHEYVGWNGEPLPGSAGRWVNPGHMIEAGIFMIHEGRYRDRTDWIRQGETYVRWGMDWGWDAQRGGIFNDIDCEGKPMVIPTPYIGYYKLWWQHTEALYGTLLAYHSSGDDWYWEAFRKVFAYCFEHFADPEHGEWIGYLTIDNTPIHHAKGTDRKNCFHLVRNLLHAAQLSHNWDNPRWNPFS